MANMLTDDAEALSRAIDRIAGETSSNSFAEIDRGDIRLLRIAADVFGQSDSPAGFISDRIHAGAIDTRMLS